MQTAARAMDAREAEIADARRARAAARGWWWRATIGSARDFEGLPRGTAILRGDGPTLVRYHDAGSRLRSRRPDATARPAASSIRPRTTRAPPATRRGDGARRLHLSRRLRAGAGARRRRSVLALDEAAPAVERARANADAQRSRAGAGRAGQRLRSRCARSRPKGAASTSWSSIRRRWPSARARSSAPSAPTRSSTCARCACSRPGGIARHLQLLGQA